MLGKSSSVLGKFQLNSRKIPPQKIGSRRQKHFLQLCKSDIEFFFFLAQIRFNILCWDWNSLVMRCVFLLFRKNLIFNSALAQCKCLFQTNLILPRHMIICLLTWKMTKISTMISINKCFTVEYDISCDYARCEQSIPTSIENIFIFLVVQCAYWRNICEWDSILTCCQGSIEMGIKRCKY